MSDLAKHNNKVGIVEEELIESKWLVQDLRIYTERVCAEHGKLKNKHSCSEFRYEDLVENFKCEFWIATFLHQEEDHLGAENTMEKIDEEWKLEVTMERHEEEHGIEYDSESESEDDRDLLLRIFYGWMSCVSWAR